MVIEWPYSEQEAIRGSYGIRELAVNAEKGFKIGINKKAHTARQLAELFIMI